jgi:septum formation protein
MHIPMNSFPDSDHVLTLASGSATRRRMLENAGLAVAQKPARIDEEAIRDALVAEEAHPRDIADALAEFKVRKVAESGLTLGSDQILALKTRVFSKPRSRDEAQAQLEALSGKTHHLYSAAVIYEGSEPVWRHVGIARMTMHAMEREEIAAYLDLAWPDVGSSVGGYHAEALGARLFSRIEGDWFSVLGLPLLDITSFLRLRGWRLA